MTDTSTTVGAAASAGALSTSGTSISNDSMNGMGESSFLTLMMDQLKAQDPLSPSDPTQFLSELANFSSLEAETSTSTSASTTAAEQASTTALGLLGHTVSYTDSSGATQTGTVTKVDFSGSDGPELTIGTATGISLSSITEAS